MDEISPVGTSIVLEVRGGKVETWRLDPADYGLDWPAVDDLAGGDPAENAARVEDLLAGKGREADRRAVLLNAAAAIYVSGRTTSYGEAVGVATTALAGGAARKILEDLKQARAFSTSG